MSDQATEQSVEDRLASFFGAPHSTDAGTESEQPEAAQDDSGASADDAAPVEASDDAEQPEQETAEDSGYEEIEIDGDTFRVPPKLREAVLRQQDYTRKTQEIAATAAQVRAQQQQLQLQAQFQQATAQDHQQLQQLESQISQYKQLNWIEMDSDTLTRARFQLDQLREQASDLRNGLNAKAQQFQQITAQQRQQQLQQGLEYLRKAIPKFDGETVSALRQYGVGEGFTQPELEGMDDPRWVKVLWKAQQYDTLKSNQKSAVEAVKKAPPVLKPGASTGQSTIAANQYKAVRGQLKKSGSLQDAARVFAMRMK